MDIEFVSYSGKYPCLCFGRLVVKVDGNELVFCSGMNLDEGDYPAFWSSGGSAGFIDWEPLVTHGEWQLNACRENYPERIWELLPKLIDVMNENVMPGCCGGCL